MENNKIKKDINNVVNDNLKALEQLFPSVVKDGQLDVKALKEELGDFEEVTTEKYELNWAGKQNAKKIVQQGIGNKTLKFLAKDSKNADTTENIYIEGDNLEVLKLLRQNYYNSIKMIYIDPPYNTGNDFVYNDTFKMDKEESDKAEGIISENNEKLQKNQKSTNRYHANWLNMMYPRLKLARDLLTDDGVIFISIDDNEQANLKRLCDEIFGEENFISNLIWQKKFSRSNDATYFSTMHDHILCYVKQNILNSQNGWEISLLPRDGVPKGYSNPDNDERGVWTSVDLSAKSGNENLIYEIETPSGRKCLPSSGRYWGVNKNKFEELIKDNRIWFGKNGNSMPRIKTFLTEVQDGLRPNSILLHEEVGHNQEGKQEIKKIFDGLGIFDSPKPTKLLKYLNLIANNKNSIILDFFSGSATTAHSVMQLNAEDGGTRKYIMVQLPELCDEDSEAYKAGYKNICEIGKERIRRAGEKIKSDESLPIENREKLDVGFKVFKLDSTNIKEWDTDTENLQQSLLDSIENIKRDRNTLDVLYEILLKYGLDLNIPIEENKDFYSIGGGSLLVSLNKEINNEVINSICEEYKKLQEIDKEFKTTVILRDNSFKDDEVKTNAIKKLEQVGINEIRSI